MDAIRGRRDASHGHVRIGPAKSLVPLFHIVRSRPIFSSLFPFPVSHLLPVLDEAVDADVVDDVPGADDERVAVLPQQLEVVGVRVVPEEAVRHT